MTRALLLALAEIRAGLGMGLVLGTLGLAILPLTLAVDAVVLLLREVGAWRVRRMQAVVCPLGHEVELAAAFSCGGCKATFLAGNALAEPCPICGAGSLPQYLSCPTCGLAIRSAHPGAWS